jgi:transposase
LEAIIAEQAAKIAELTEKLQRNSSNSSKPPSCDFARGKPAPPKERGKRRRGGQPGHCRVLRPLVPPEKVAAVVDHVPNACGHCGAELTGSDPEPLRHQIAEIPPIEPTVIEHRLHRLDCECCGRSTRAPLPADVPRGHFGERLTALLSLLSGGYRLGKRGVQQLAADAFGLTISLGMICKLQKTMAAALQPTVDELAVYVRTQNAHIDETGWRENRKRAVLWVVVTPLVTRFKIAGNRSAEVAKELLGDDYAMTAICDRHKGYLWIRHIQVCWAHLRRDFQAMIDRANRGTPIGEELLAISDVLFHWWHQVRDGTLRRASFQRYASLLKAEVHDQLERGAECGCAKTEGTCIDLLDREKQLWPFVNREGVEPTNNAAERSLRHAVLWRKASFGTDSSDGSRFVERILSVVATCRQQNQSVIEILTQAIAAYRNQTSAPSLLPALRQAKAA